MSQAARLGMALPPDGKTRMTRHPRLMSPQTLRGPTRRNRIVFAAHTANTANEGLPMPRYGACLPEQAPGGAAMIVGEPVPVHRSGVLTRGNFLHGTDDMIPHVRKISGPVKKAGAVILQQLCHIGAHGDSDLSFAPHWSLSGGPSCDDSDGSHAMTGAEVEELLQTHANAAVRCRKAGFQGGRGLGRLSFAAGPVLDALVQQPHRSVGRQPAEPHPAFVPADRAHPPRLRR
jgi:2,4-dienoyl-CoA reductase-like NADH-dependent reductase (Old Yellow Enzyme family)